MTQPNGAASAAADDDVRPDDLQPEAEAAEPPMVEVEHEGQTYAVPAALKGALMRHADYTRKTQELAHHRRALEAARQGLAEASQAHGEHLGERTRVMLLEQQIQQLSQMNWPALQQHHPAQAQQMLHQLFQLKQAHEIAVDRLRHQMSVKAFDRQREHARRVEQADAVLAEHIEDWSPRKAGELAQFAISQGISPEELDELSDPRLVLLLHHAHAGHQGRQQASAAERLTRPRRSAPRSRWAEPAADPRTHNACRPMTGCVTGAANSAQRHDNPWPIRFSLRPKSPARRCASCTTS